MYGMSHLAEDNAVPFQLDDLLINCLGLKLEDICFVVTFYKEWQYDNLWNLYIMKSFLLFTKGIKKYYISTWNYAGSVTVRKKCPVLDSHKSKSGRSIFLETPLENS